MERRQWEYVTRRAGAGIMVCLALLCAPAASIAADPANLPAEGVEHAGELLARGAGYGQPQNEGRVRALQRRLRALGQRPGPVDGLYGPLTEAAVEGLQRESGLSVDGVVGPQTRRVLNAETPPLVSGAGYGRPGGSPQVRAVQRSLRSVGQRLGPVDGLYGPRTMAAVARFQRTVGQPASGVLSPATARSLANAGGDQTASNVRDASRPDRPSGQRGQRPVERPAAPGATTGQSRPSDSSKPGEQSDQSRRRNPKAVDGRVERTVGAEPSSPYMLVGLALALSAIGGLLVGWLRRKRREPETSAAAGRPVPAAVSTTPSNVNGSSSGRGTPGSAPREGQEPALGYVSVRKRSASEKELRQQTAAIQTACRQRGLSLERVIVDAGQADATLSQRPGMRKALERLASDDVSCLVVAGLGRLNCSPQDVGRLILWLRLQDAGLVAVDEEIDTGTQSGRVAADMLAALCAVGGQPHAPRPAGNPAPETRPPGRSNGPAPQVSRGRANPSRTDSSRDGEENRSGSGGPQRPRGTRATSSSKEGAIR